MTHVYIGCNEIVGRRQLYFARLSALEVEGTARGSVSAKRLNEWRTESPKGFAFAMTIPSAITAAEPVLPEGFSRADDELAELGLLQTTDVTRRLWAQTLDLAKSLAPKVLRLVTPREFTPNKEHRRRIEWFAGELAPQTKATIAWEPHGLWDLEETIPWARKLGLAVVHDPLAELEVEPGHGTAYFALYTRRGLRTRFDDFDMEDLLDACATYQRAVIIFRGGDRYRDARLCHEVYRGRGE